MNSLNVVVQIIIAILVFGFLILIHEFGHFIVGKLSGMQVNEFSIGMGPAIFSYEKGETRYAVRLLPIGGFVAVEGEDTESTSTRSFAEIPIGRRILFVCAGALMNLLLGFILFSVLIGRSETIPTTIVGGFHENAVSSTSLAAGDKILAVNGSRVFTVNDISFSLMSDQDGIIDFTVERDGKKLSLPAVQFDMQTLEDGQRMIRLDFFVYSQENTFLSGASYTVNWMFSTVRQVWLSFINLITGNIKLAELSGPVGVSAAIGEASTRGLNSNAFLSMIGFISVNIGVFNLLPLPALDGGRLLFLLIELVSRRKVPAKYEGAIHAAGLIFFLGLIVVVSFQDIARLF